MGYFDSEVIFIIFERKMRVFQWEKIARRWRHNGPNVVYFGIMKNHPDFVWLWAETLTIDALCYSVKLPISFAAHCIITNFFP